LINGGALFIVDLGAGRGFNGLNLIRAYEKVSGYPIPDGIVESHPGDVAACYADISLGAEIFDWSATKGFDDRCVDLALAEYESNWIFQ
jgi:UDP-glucose 4-epimerase